jgi:hypothetical protein
MVVSFQVSGSPPSMWRIRLIRNASVIANRTALGDVLRHADAAGRVVGGHGGLVIQRGHLSLMAWIEPGQVIARYYVAFLESPVSTLTPLPLSVVRHRGPTLAAGLSNLDYADRPHPDSQ